MLSFLSTTNSFSDGTCTGSGKGTCTDANANCLATVPAETPARNNCKCKANFVNFGGKCIADNAIGKLISIKYWDLIYN